MRSDYLNEKYDKRYERHLILENIGVEGQQKISDGRVLIIGLGGLGSATVLYLAASGVGTLGIADSDVVELTNLHRQILHAMPDMGKLKTLSATSEIEKINPDINVRTYKERITKENISAIIRDYDFVLDCTDNFETKFLINDACVSANKPFSHCGVSGFLGQTITYVPGSACYRCIFGRPPDEIKGPIGVLGTIPGILGTIQATEAIKYLIKKGELLLNKLLIIDAFTMKIRTVKVNRDSKCLACGSYQN